MSAEDVDRVLARIREGHATYDAVEGRPVKDGDFALVDIKGTFPAGDGEDFNREKVLVEIGGEGTLPELSAHLRNAEAGATVSFQKSFAADGSDSEFAGKTVLYTVHLVAIKTRVLPALDDELGRLALTPREGEAPEGASLDDAPGEDPGVRDAGEGADRPRAAAPRRAGRSPRAQRGARARVHGRVRDRLGAQGVRAPHVAAGRGPQGGEDRLERAPQGGARRRPSAA